jgi:hypothetical protein
MKILATILLVWVASCGTLLSEIVVGSSKKDVIAEWGKPSSQFTTGGTLTFIYADGREVDFENGKVVNVSKVLTSSNKAAATSRTSRVDAPPITPARQPAAEVKKTVPEQPKAVPAKTNAPAAAPAVAPAKTNALTTLPVVVAPKTNAPATSPSTTQARTNTPVATTNASVLPPSPAPAQTNAAVTNAPH